ncbi:MAG TPA: hypothetical protein VIN03_09865 [Roseateles sp.]
MLVRLVPGSRPDELRLKAVPWQTAGLMGRLYALAPQPADQAVCRQKLAAMNCKSSCSERIKSFPGQLRWRFFADQSIKALAPQARPAACLGESRFEAVAQRQRDASATPGAGWKR